MKTDLKEKTRVIDGFPKEGVLFRDITTLLNDKDAYKYAVDLMVDDSKDKGITVIAAPEARGFSFGSAVAYALGVRFTPIRKPGRLPGGVSEYSYDLEYDTDKLEVHRDVIKGGDKITIVDDLLATGGIVNAVVKLIEKNGGEIAVMEFLIKLIEFGGRDINKDHYINILVQYKSQNYTHMIGMWIFYCKKTQPLIKKSC